MKGAKLIGWGLIVLGLIGFGIMYYEHYTDAGLEFQKKYGQLTPVWKQWFNTCSYLIGGIVILYSIKRFEKNTLHDSHEMIELKRGRFFSIALILMGLGLCIETIGEVGRIKEIYIFNGVILVVGALWFLLMKYLIKKQLERESE